MDITVTHTTCPVPRKVIFSKIIKTVSQEKKNLLREVVEVIEKHFPCTDSERFHLKLCIDEGLQNAFSHGNRSDPEKEISVVCFEDEQFWGVIIRDEGDGFQPENLRDARSKEALMKENGRGLLIMKEYMDDITYFEGGRILKLVKQK
jgi:serine/threonine-protein kinase RsbW